MGLCDSPAKILKKKFRHRKTSFSTGRNAGHRYRGLPKQEYVTIPFVVHQPEDTVTLPLDFSVPSLPRSKEMWDTHGFQQNWYNPCTREEYDGPAQPLPILVDDDGAVVTPDQDMTYSPRDLIRRTLPFLDSAALDELALRSQQKLTSVVNTDTSIANFIIELIEACEGNIKGITRFKNIYERCLKAYQEAYKRFLKQGHKESAARWLAWNFAIKPFLKDLRAILCSISAAYKKLKWLQDHNHKIVYLDYMRDDLADKIDYDPNEWKQGQFFSSILKAEPLLGYPNGSHQIVVRYNNVKVLYHARSKIFLDIPDKWLDGMNGITTLWGTMMGLENPVGIIWEAIPFSWLIDYFLSYRDRLWETALDTNPYNKGVKVLGFGHSFTYTAHISTAWQWTPIGGDPEILSWGGGGKYSLFVRMAGLPFPEQEDHFRLPDSWYKLSILVAIGIGFLPPRKR